MRKFFVFLFAASIIELAAGSVVGGLLTKDPHCSRFTTDKTPAASIVSKLVKKDDGSAVVEMKSDNPKGSTQLIFRGIEKLDTNKDYYFTFDYNISSFEPGSGVIIVLNLKDASGKNIKSYWSRKAPFSTIGKQDFFHHFRVKEDAPQAEIVVYFQGIFAADALNFNLGRQTPQDPETGNLFWNPSFEKNQLPGFYPTPRLGKEFYKGKGIFTYGRRTGNARTGTYAYYVKNERTDASMLINIMNIPYIGAKRYRFSCWAKVISAEGKTGISASVGCVNAQGKITYRYPRLDTTPGDWKELKDEFYAPADTVGFKILFWVSGKQEVYLDDFFFGPAEVEKKKTESRNTAALIKESAAFTLWQDAAYLKPAMSGIPANMPAKSGVSITCAANESEPFSLVLAPKKPLTAVNVIFSDLSDGRNIIAKENLSWRRVDFIYMKDAEYNPTLKGWVADPLMPGKAVDAAAGKNLPFYLTAAVPAGTPAGTYRGTVKITANDQLLAEVPLSVKVRNFELPTTPHMRNFFYLWANQPTYRMHDKRPLDEVVANFEKLFKEHRMVGNQAKHPPKVEWEIKDGNLVITGFEEFDAAISRWYADGMRYFVTPPLNFLGHYHGWIEGNKTLDKPGKSPFCNESWVSANGLKYAAQFAKQYMDHVRVKFPDARFYAYLFDEPQPPAYADLKKIITTLHDAAPDLNIFIPKDITDEIGPVQSWCVPLAPGLLNLPKQRIHQQKGGEIWYYNWTVCMDDHDYIRTRLYAWQIFSADGNGGLLWNTIISPMGYNPWDSMDKTPKIGGATIFYPPKAGSDGAVPSIRSMQIKESFDDFDYMTILANEIDKRFPGCGRIRVKEIISELIYDIPFEFHNNHPLMYALRDKIADEIEEVKKLPVLAASSPREFSQVEVTAVDFKIHAPAGSKVSIDGRSAGIVPADGVLKFTSQLNKIGKNTFNIAVESNGKKTAITRTYFLKRDQNLNELEKLVKTLVSEPALAAPIREFLGKTAKNPVYGDEERKYAAKLLTSTKQELLKKQLSGKKSFRNEVEKRFFERASEAEKNRCYDRASYYLGLAKRAAQAYGMKNFKVRLTPSVCQGHPGFVLDNGIISVGFTETAGRIYSFKVRGTECLFAGNYSNALPPEMRMKQQVTKEMVQHHVDYAGFADEAAMGHWPVSLVDWDLELLELEPERISVAVSIRFPDKPFRFKRTMTMSAGSPDLEIGYEVVNVMPKGMSSDDPGHYQFAWRGRFVPAIGSDGAENDVLVMPAAGITLPETRFSQKNPVFYERPNFMLAKPVAGVYDPASGKGFAMIGGKEITHGYIWFNSRGNHKGEGKRYTLEFPRSRYGQRNTDKNQNMPFDIQPGNILRFKLKLRGLENVKDNAAFESAVK